MTPNPRPVDDERVADDLRAIRHDEERLRQIEGELSTDEAALERDLHHQHEPTPRRPHGVEMNYHPLVLVGDRLTGLQIKEQALVARVPNIKTDFHLTVERPSDDIEHTIGDHEDWTVHDGDSFTAVKPDDNS